MNTFDKIECIRSCPRYNDYPRGCSVPVCPLDPDCLSRVHRGEDQVCIYLRETAKQDGNLQSAPDLTPEQIKTVNANYEPINAKFGKIRKALKRSAKTRSKLKMNPRCQKVASEESSGQAGPVSCP